MRPVCPLAGPARHRDLRCPITAGVRICPVSSSKSSSSVPGPARPSHKRTSPPAPRVASRPRKARLELIRERLLAWYAAHQRPLPWRLSRDPYAILVSEIMLQQTQVERVIPKYREFLERFPTLKSLAAAPLGEVIRAWGPLGYNQRAVRLHQLANLVMERRSGKLPTQPDELIELPGLGPYTAAAVACFAFDRPVATLDTNVRRVLGRVLSDEPGFATRSGRALAAAAGSVLPVDRAADWNQALMDLGATVCTARTPSCHHCPLAEACAARRTLQQTPCRPVRRAAEGRVAYRADEPYVGSTRFYRGRIVDRLRELAPGSYLTIDELGSAILPGFEPARREWLLRLLQRLAADGLVVLADDGPAAASATAVRVALP